MRPRLQRGTRCDCSASLVTSSVFGAARCCCCCCSSSKKSRGRSLRVSTRGGVFSDRLSSGVDWMRSRSLGRGNCRSLPSPAEEEKGIRVKNTESNQAFLSTCTFISLLSVPILLIRHRAAGRPKSRAADKGFNTRPMIRVNKGFSSTLK